MSTYGNTAGAGEGSSMKFIEPGVHKLHIESVEVVAVKTAKYEGNAADITFANDSGATITHRIFPYVYEEGKKNFDGTKELSQQDQFTDYFAKLNHLFFKAAGGEERYAQATDDATSFEDFINRVNSVVSKANGGKDFWQLIITNNAGYTTVALWKGGSCEAWVEGTPSTLYFDAEKYGKKEPNNTEATQASTVDQLPFKV